MTTKNEAVSKRYDFVLFFDVQDGNPNGDPDAGNQPRTDPETGHGLVTDVCLKRKVRNYVTLTRRGEQDQALDGYDIYVKERGILANQQRRAYMALGKTEGSDVPNEDARRWMCRNFYDIRAFGAVMTVGKAPAPQEEAKGKKAKEMKWNCGQVRGPVQLTFARSVDPIVTLEHAITRVALTNAGDTGFESAEGEERAASGQMGRKNTVPYGLYRAHGFVAPSGAKDTGFSAGDLELLWEALEKMFEHDRSATRGLMATRALVVFEHEGALGDAPSHRLFERVSARRVNAPARSFGDYEVMLDGARLDTSKVRTVVAAKVG